MIVDEDIESLRKRLINGASDELVKEGLRVASALFLYRFEGSVVMRERRRHG